MKLFTLTNLILFSLIYFAKASSIDLNYEIKYSQFSASLPIISSQLKNLRGRTRGTGFVVENISDNDCNGECKKFIITNKHLLDGTNKQVTINDNNNIKILNDEPYFCSIDDIAIIPITNEKLKTFATLELENGQYKIIAYGMNNSPRAYSGPIYLESNQLNYNANRPVFFNQLAEENFPFVQLADMFDFSCNKNITIPIPYFGTAFFTPINQLLRASLKGPIPFSKVYKSTIKKMKLIQSHGKCNERATPEIHQIYQPQQLLSSDHIITPSRIVGGMSGSPLLTSDDLRKKRYDISGMIVGYDPKLLASKIIGIKSILNCLTRYMNLKNQKRSTHISVKQGFLKAPTVKMHNLFLKYERGDNDYADGGDNLLQSNKNNTIGIITKDGNNIIEYNCIHKKNNKQINLYANKEAIYLLSSSKLKEFKCTPKNIKQIDLHTLIVHRNNNKEITSKKSCDLRQEGFQLCLKISRIEHNEFEFTLYKYRSFIDEELDTFTINFDQIRQLKIMFKSKSGDKYIYDFRNLFFTDLNRIRTNDKQTVAEQLLNAERPKVIMSKLLNQNGEEIGSIPLEFIY